MRNRRASRSQLDGPNRGPNYELIRPTANQLNEFLHRYKTTAASFRPMKILNGRHLDRRAFALRGLAWELAILCTIFGYRTY